MHANHLMTDTALILLQYTLHSAAFANGSVEPINVESNSTDLAFSTGYNAILLSYSLDYSSCHFVSRYHSGTKQGFPTLENS